MATNLIKLRSEDTDGRLGLIEQVVPAGFPGPALHVHPHFDEMFYVVEGELAFRVGDDARVAGGGSVAFIPRGTPHTFANPGGDPARVLVPVTPGGFERYFEALAAAIMARGGFPGADEVAALGIAHGSIPARPGMRGAVRRSPRQAAAVPAGSRRPAPRASGMRRSGRGRPRGATSV